MSVDGVCGGVSRARARQPCGKVASKGGLSLLCTNRDRRVRHSENCRARFGDYYLTEKGYFLHHQPIGDMQELPSQNLE